MWKQSKHQRRRIHIRSTHCSQGTFINVLYWAGKWCLCAVVSLLRAIQGRRGQQQQGPSSPNHVQVLLSGPIFGEESTCSKLVWRLLSVCWINWTVGLLILILVTSIKDDDKAENRKKLFAPRRLAKELSFLSRLSSKYAAFPLCVSFFEWSIRPRTFSSSHGLSIDKCILNPFSLTYFYVKGFGNSLPWTGCSSRYQSWVGLTYIWNVKW